MKFAIIGSGAIGGFIALKLHLINEEVHLIARGKTFDVIKNNGIKIISENQTIEGYPFITNNFNSIGVVDYLFLTVKAHNIAEIGPKLAPLIDKNTSIISTQNGIPWWYFHYTNSSCCLRVLAIYIQSTIPAMPKIGIKRNTEYKLSRLAKTSKGISSHIAWSKARV